MSANDRGPDLCPPIVPEHSIHRRVWFGFELGFKIELTHPAKVAMEIFVHQQNLLFLRKELAETPNEARRAFLMRLLAEEQAKNSPPPKEK